MTPNDIAYTIDRRRKQHLQNQPQEHEVRFFRMLITGFAISAAIWILLFLVIDGFLHHFHFWRP